MPRNLKIQLRKGTNAEWLAPNNGNGVILASGEPGFDLTNNILKIGDGSTYWSNLEPIGYSAANVLSEEPNGFVNTTDSVITTNFSNVDSLGSGIVTLAPSADSFDVFIRGSKQTFNSTLTAYIPDTTDLYFVYIDKNDSILKAKAAHMDHINDIPVSYIYWNTNNNQIVYLAEERHGIKMDSATHYYLHRVFGAQYISGLGVTFNSLEGDGSTDVDSKISISDGVIFDEDDEINIINAPDPNNVDLNNYEQILSPIAKIPVLYKDGVNGEWKYSGPTNYPLKIGSSAQYNQYTGSTWTTTDGGNGKFIGVWIVATNNILYPIIAIMGQRVDDNIGQSDTNNLWESLDLTDLPVVEIRPLYRLIFETDSRWTSNASRSALRNVKDIRTITNITGGGLSPSDHGNLFGLLDDDHPQYVHTSTGRTVSALHNFSNGLLINGIPAPTGTGTSGYISKFVSPSGFGNSVIYDNGTGIGINTTSVVAAVSVDGHVGLFPRASTTGWNNTFYTYHNTSTHNSYGITLGYEAETERYSHMIFAPEYADISFKFDPANTNHEASGQSIFSTKMLIRGDNGNVGIGVSDPYAKLSIYSSTSGDRLLNIEGTNGNLFSVVDSASGSLMSVNDITGLPAFEVFSDHSIVAGRFNTNDFVISSGGNVGIGASSPSTKLDVSGVITATGGNSTQWNTAYGWGDHASAGYLSATGGTITNNLTIGGNLTVNGDTVVANVSSMQIEDPILTLGLASGNIITDDSYDRGIAMVTNNGTAFMGWDNSADRFVLLSSGVATNGSGNYDAGAYGDLMLNRLYGPSGNAYIQLNYADSNRIDFNSTDLYYNGTSYFGGNSYLLRLGSATSTSTQKDSYQLVFQNALWNGSSQQYFTSHIKSIASTTENLKSRIAFNTHNESNNTQVERVSILSNGKVGIGTTTPSETLEVNGNLSFSTINSKIYLRNDSSRIVGIENEQSSPNSDLNLFARGIATGWHGNIKFYTSYNSNTLIERVRITSLGNVGIGTTSPSCPLTVQLKSSTNNTIIQSSGVTPDPLLQIITYPTLNRCQLTIGTYNAIGSPNYSFYDDPDTGIAGGFAANTLEFVAAGTRRSFIDSNGIALEYANSIAASGISSQRNSNDLTFRNSMWRTDTNVAYNDGSYIRSVASTSVAGDSRLSFYIAKGYYNGGGQAERLSLLNDGKVGIDTAVPDEKLVVSATTNANCVLWERSNTPGTEFGYYFRSTANNTTGFKKAGMVFEVGADGYSTGKLHILCRGGIDATNATVANASRITILNDGKVGIGTDSPSYKLQVNGSFGATTKSFRIDHPSRPNYTLEYGSLESPYHGVRLTGRGRVVKGSGTVLLPSYLKDLIHDNETINIQITNIKHGKTIYVDEIDLNNDRFTVKADRCKTLGDLEFFWTFTGTRKDVDNLVVEREK